MVSSIGQNNNVQRFSAVNALRANSKPIKQNTKAEDTISSAEEMIFDEPKAPKSLLDRINTDEVREYAKFVGEFNITDDDIKYGLLYGRSVIAEFLA